MSRREYHYRWEWHLGASPEALWPLVADTNRFNRDAGVPALEGEDDPAVATDAGRRRLRLRRLGLSVEWVEEPFEWIEPHRFSVVRRYRKGPLTEMRVATELSPRSEGGTAIVYEVWARPRNLLGIIAIPLQIGFLSARRFDSVFRSYDRLAQQRELAPDTRNRVRLAPGGRARATAASAELTAAGIAPSLVSRLVGLLERGDDLTVGRLRPYALADVWNVDRRPVLELFLHATRVGLLEFSWDLLCPLCRGAKERAPTLSQVDPQVHCDTCNIDFEVNFDRSVELTFRANSAVRVVQPVSFCIGGPRVTPHIVVQQLVPPGVAHTLGLDLDLGRYRVRTLALRGGQLARVGEDAPVDVRVRAHDSGWPTTELEMGRSPRLRLENETAREQLFVIERTAWADDALTAAEVTALQLFRDLFATEALRPGEPISVGSLTVVFTDLRDSTRFYRDVGDAPAFGSVMDHLELLRRTVTSEDGAIVKAMGDAIMAVFSRPVSAVRAVLRAQQAVAAPADGGPSFSLKAGIHAGPCIAVNQNGRLDYFGSTVNLAARLVDLSSGSDVIVSEAVQSDPEVAELLRADVRAESLEASLKGFDDAQFALWRLSDGSPDGR
jgi:class 3 adenylate cyclase